MLKNGEMYLNVNGIKHWVKITQIEKNTTPLVIIHGGPGGHNYAFEHTAGKKLEEMYTVIYYEQRGSGRSSAPMDDTDYKFETLLDDLKEICSQLNLEKIIPLGYSFGGEIAIRFAIKYPNLVSKIIVEAPSIISNINKNALIQYKGFLEVANDEEKRMFMSIDTGELYGVDLMKYLWDNTSSTTQSKFMFYNQDNAKKMYKLWGKAWDELKLSNTGKMAEVIFNEIDCFDILESSKSIKCETLILIGDNDRNCGVDLAEEYHNNIFNSKLVIVKEAAHFVDFEQEETFIKEINNFLNS
jgi:proline iminopeptidase